MKQRTYLFALLLLPYFTHAVHYRTLLNGNWNNTTNVWSTNGSSPCGCAPASNLISDTITINHPVNLTSHLTAAAASRLEINTNGTLTNSLFDVTVSNSIFLANGSINIKKLIVQNGGSLQITNSVLMLNGPSTVNGLLTATSSNIYLLSGNLDISIGAQLNLLNGSRIQITNGNIRNYGQLSICPTCCIAFDRGGINNESSGQVLGDGAAITYNGNFKNLNTWSIGVDYCSTGNDQGMPLTENCNSANAICLNSPLAVFVTNFSVLNSDQSVRLSWEANNEESTIHYVLSRSPNGKDWGIMERIEPHSSSSEVVSYTFEDDQPYNGINYYRLSVVDDSDTLSQLMTSIQHKKTEEIRLFPNPTENSVTLICSPSLTEKSVYLYSPIGELIRTVPWPAQEDSILIYLPSAYGVYFITVADAYEIQHFKIRKIGE
jgi:hypothetical protein